jgi:glycosyltransferase involved in cell wall biosynthesis
MMSIVMANNYLYPRGGAERVMLDEMQWLREEGYSATAFGRTQVGAAELPYGELFPRLPNAAPKGIWEQVKTGLQTVYNPDTGRRFAEYCRRTKPELVHCHNIYSGLTTAVLDACSAQRIPCVITLHDYKLACPSYTMLRDGKPCSLCSGGKFYHCVLTRCHKERRAVSMVSTVEAYFNVLFKKYQKAALLLAPSKFLASRMVDYGLPQSKLRYLPNAVDTSRFTPRYSDDGYFLYMGRLSSEKGLRTLVAATDGCGMPLRIAGDGPELEPLRACARNLRNGSVSFDGRMNADELAIAVRGAAFVVVPSEWYENASMAVLEAMACGKPVIAARIGGLPEQIDSGRTGLLFQPGDQHDLSNCIRTLVGQPEVRRAMGTAARQRVIDEFSRERHCRSLSEFYREAINADPIPRLNTQN